MNETISFNWDIHWACNYRCPYCWFNGQWEQLKERNRYPAAEDVCAAWERIYARYGAVKLSITGGEPFAYPRFTEIIAGLSRRHRIEIISNLSSDIEGFINAVDAKAVVVNPSFHSLFADEDVFIERVTALKRRNMCQAVTFLAWPPSVPKLGYYREKFRRQGVELTIQPFYGEYEGRRYPDGYTGEEKKAVGQGLGERGGERFLLETSPTRGKLCNAGRRYGVVHPDGTVLRCGGRHSSDPAVGNIFDENFRLLEEPRPCTAEVCPCNEWAFLLEKENGG